MFLVVSKMSIINSLLSNYGDALLIKPLQSQKMGNSNRFVGYSCNSGVEICHYLLEDPNRHEKYFFFLSYVSSTSLNSFIIMWGNGFNKVCSNHGEVFDRTTLWAFINFRYSNCSEIKRRLFQLTKMVTSYVSCPSVKRRSNPFLTRSLLENVNRAPDSMAKWCAAAKARCLWPSAGTPLLVHTKALILIDYCAMIKVLLANRV